jgi:hypothetical protein
MKPNKKLTVAQFKRFFTPWRYAPKRMIWDGRFISVQPVTPKPAASTASSAAASKAAADPAIGAASVVLARLSVGPSLAAAVPATTSSGRRRRRPNGRPTRDRARSA